MRKINHAYYRAHAADFQNLDSIPQREFAYLPWDKPGMRRHIAFSDSQVLIQDLIMNAPRHAYHSAAYYARPSAEAMDKKDLLGCEFVIDVDADHIPTSCINQHNYFICQSCKEIGTGEKPEKCPKCGANKFEKIVWICDECLNAAKKQIFRLVDNFLLDDFGIPLEDLDLYFSGHRGYHIHVKTESIKALDQEARREIADYVGGQGFSFHALNFQKIQSTMHGFHMDQIGWPGKIAKELYQTLLLEGPEIQEIFAPYMNSNFIKILVENKPFLLQALKNRNQVWQVKGLGEQVWYQIFDALKDRLRADIDAVVSIDLHRLIRLENSLNGKTGFVVKPIKYENLKAFDPLADALAFPQSKDLMKLEIVSQISPPIRIGDVTYGPYNREEKIEVPFNVGLFLVNKDVAQLAFK